MIFEELLGSGGVLGAVAGRIPGGKPVLGWLVARRLVPVGFPGGQWAEATTPGVLITMGFGVPTLARTINISTFAARRQ